MSALRETPVVTCFLRHDGELLLLRRSDAVGSYPGRWGAVAGFLEAGDADGSAWREVAEETGLTAAVVRLERRGEPFVVEDERLGRRWRVHPYLFDAATRDVRLDWESTAAEWVPATEILRRDAVPGLWASWRRVAPTVESIAADREHGSAHLSMEALEVLRDAAATLPGGDGREAHWQELRRLAHRLVACRPAMAVLANRVNRAMHASRGAAAPAAVEAAARRALVAAARAEQGAAAAAASRVAGCRVLTLSRSGTVLAALRQAKPAPRVVVSESRPGSEGVGVAEELAGAGLGVTLVADAALAWAIDVWDIEVVLLGADAVLPSGAVVNKTGSRPAALAARGAGARVLVVAACDKVAAAEDAAAEEAPREQLYAGQVPVAVRNPRFERLPAQLVDAILTERGAMPPSAVAAVARELAALRDW